MDTKILFWRVIFLSISILLATILINLLRKGFKKNDYILIIGLALLFYIVIEMIGRRFIYSKLKERFQSSSSDSNIGTRIWEINWSKNDESVNFISGNRIAFHFVIRSNTTAFNSKDGSNWEAEVNSGAYHGLSYPIKTFVKFNKNGFEIIYNDKITDTFPNRFNLQSPNDITDVTKTSGVTVKEDKFVKNLTKDYVVIKHISDIDGKVGDIIRFEGWQFDTGVLFNKMTNTRTNQSWLSTADYANVNWKNTYIGSLTPNGLGSRFTSNDMVDASNKIINEYILINPIGDISGNIGDVVKYEGYKVDNGIIYNKMTNTRTGGAWTLTDMTDNWKNTYIGIINANGLGSRFTSNDMVLLDVPSVPTWDVVYSKGSYGNVDKGKDATNNLFKRYGVFKRECAQCADQYKEIFYKRITPINNFSAYDSFNNWTSAENILNRDFKLFYSYDDLLNDRNGWTSCNYDDQNIGFPRDCSGSKGFAAAQWNSLTRGGQPDVKFSVIKDESAPSTSTSSSSSSATVDARRAAIKAQDDAIKKINPYSWFDSYSAEPASGTWKDLSGNNRNAAINANVVIDKSDAKVPWFIKGGTNATVDISGNAWVPTNTSYTIIHLTKYNGGSRGRIWNGKSENWLSGFWNDKVGFHHNGWLTISSAPNDKVPSTKIKEVPEGAPQHEGNCGVWIVIGDIYRELGDDKLLRCTDNYQVTTFKRERIPKTLGEEANNLTIGNSGQDWLLIVDQIDYNKAGAARINSVFGFNGGSTTAIPNGIGINLGGEQSDWACYEMIVFNRALSLNEIRTVEKALIEKYVDVPSIANLGPALNAQIETALETDRRELIKAQDNFIKSYKPYSWFDSYSADPKSGTWKDLSGNNRNATLSAKVSLDMSDTKVPVFIKGGTDSTVDISGNAWVPTNTSYTIIHLTKYNGGSRGRIWNGKTENWLSGFYNDKVGIHHNSWLTISSAPNDKVPVTVYTPKQVNCRDEPILEFWMGKWSPSGHYRYVCDTVQAPSEGTKTIGQEAYDLTIGNSGQDWLLIVDQIEYNKAGASRINVEYGFTGGSTTAIPNGIGINLGGEKSDWACYEMIVFDRALNFSEIRKLEKALIEKYADVPSIANLETVLANQVVAAEIAAWRANIKAQDNKINSYKPFSWFDSYSADPAAGTWKDLSGNNRNAGLSTNVVVEKNASPWFIRGGTNATVDISGNSWVGKDSSYTIFHITRYNGDTRRRIWNGKTENWLSGYWNYRVGFHHNSWMTVSSAPNNSIPATDMRDREEPLSTFEIKKLFPYYRCVPGQYIGIYGQVHLKCINNTLAMRYELKKEEYHSSRSIGQPANNLTLGDVGKEWLLMVDQIDYNKAGAARINTVYGFTGGSTTAVPDGIGINLGANNEPSDWACYEMIVFDRALSLSEIKAVERALIEKYANVPAIAQLKDLSKVKCDNWQDKSIDFDCGDCTNIDECKNAMDLKTKCDAPKSKEDCGSCNSNFSKTAYATCMQNAPNKPGECSNWAELSADYDCSTCSNVDQCNNAMSLKRQCDTPRTKADCNNCNSDYSKTSYDACMQRVPAPVDCVVGNWTNWSSCDPTTLKKTRTGSIITPKQGDGKDCEPTTQKQDCVMPVDCVVGNWTNWSSCDPTTLKKTRTGSIITPKAGDGKDCEPTTQKQDCVMPIDCIVGNWGSWSACNPNTLKKTRTGTILRSQEGDGKACEPTTQTQDCVMPVDCVVGNWTAWNDCNPITLKQTRTGSIVTPKAGDGKDCGPTTQTQDCVMPVDCVVGGWSPWSACDPTTLKQKRTGTIITPKQGTGKDCEPTTQTRDCVMPVNCVLSEWGRWSDCDPNTLKQTRTRTIVTPKKGDGLDCENTTQTQSCFIPPPPEPAFDPSTNPLVASTASLTSQEAKDVRNEYITTITLLAEYDKIKKSLDNPLYTEGLTPNDIINIKKNLEMNIQYSKEQEAREKKLLEDMLARR